jgi:translocator protein
MLGLLAWLAACFAAAVIGALFMPGTWYEQLRKPAWNPPNWIFGPVWTLLYATMAVAAWLVWQRGRFTDQRLPLSLFLLQLLLNAIWSPLFFGLHSAALGLVDILLLWMALLGTILAFFSGRVASAAFRHNQHRVTLMVVPTDVSGARTPLTGGPAG